MVDESGGVLSIYLSLPENLSLRSTSVGRALYSLWQQKKTVTSNQIVFGDSNQKMPSNDSREQRRGGIIRHCG